MSEPTSFDRCPAAHPEDLSPCEGPQDAVTVVDRQGAEALGCVHHAARLYASLDRPRVYPSEGHLGAAVEVYRRAQQLKPFGWMRGER